MSSRGQKQEVEALRKEAARLRMALDSAGQGVWDHDLRTGAASFSDTWKRMRGYLPDEDVDAIGGAWADRLHPDDRERILKATALQDIGQLQFNAFEYRERHRNGHWIWILSRGRPVEWNADGSVARILGTDTDISALKASEAALAKEKERLLVTLRSMGDGLVSADPDGAIVNFNAAAAEITGWSPEEVIGKNITLALDLRSPLNVPLTELLIGKTRLLQQGGGHIDDAVLVRRDGTERRANCSVSPVMTENGQEGLVIVFRDTTEEHALRCQLAHAASHDGLTGLPNRSAFEKTLEAVIAIARETGRSHALCVLDLDGFKAINDAAGHAAGDVVLQQVSNALKEACRAEDFVARLGGDEFAVILADANFGTAELICRQLTRAVSSLRFIFDKRIFSVGVSVGVKLISGTENGIASLMLEADRACYLAKAAGKGTHVMADRLNAA